MVTELHPYMVYSRSAGSAEAAYLVFAHNRQEARVIGFDGELTDEWIDVAVNRLKEDYFFEYGHQEKLSFNIAHRIDSPPVCKGCGFWGVSKLNDEGYCHDCQREK